MKFKRAIALIMIFAVVFSLSACGSKKGERFKDSRHSYPGRN